MTAQIEHAITHALVHSVWQGALAALFLAAVLALFRTARARYAAACVALAALAVAFAVTFAIQLPGAGTATLLRPPLPGAGAAASGLWTGDSMLGFRLNVPWLAPLWLGGALLLQLRMLRNWMAVTRLRRRGVCLASSAWQTRLEALARRIRLTMPVRLLESGLTRVPSVAGYWRPVILVPAGLLTSLPASQIDLILLHELAHVRRRDYLVNLVQSFVENLLYYHPAAWWISGVIRAEREHCCDDLAVSAGRDGGHCFASALVALEEMRSARESETAPAVLMAATGGSLRNRVRRLLGQPPRQASPAAAPPIFAAALLAGLVAWHAVATPMLPAQDVPTPYSLWLNQDVVYIIAPEERAAFERLRTDEERERFIGQFWQKRDPTPATGENEAKEEHYRRIGYANSRFKTTARQGWQTDRGRIYIQHGPPDEIESHPREGRELWIYTERGIRLRFLDADRTGEYKLSPEN